MGKKSKKFLIICGIVIGAGLLLTAIGAAAGGVKNMNSLSDHYTWIAGPSVDEEEQSLDPVQTFTAVKATGDMDVSIVKGSEDSVKMVYPKGRGTCSMTVEDGTLMAEYDAQQKVVINFSDEDSAPRLVISRKDPASIESVEADLSYGDITMEQITVKTAVLRLEDGDVELSNTQIGTLDADLDYGDLEGEHVTCTTITASLEDGDCELYGIFDGNSTITSQYGDVELHTTLPESQYTVIAQSDYGDLEIGGTERSDNGTLTVGSGACRLDLKTADGDIKVGFASR